MQSNPGDLIAFQFESTAVRVQVDDAGLPWFSASDVCSILGFGNSRQALESHVDLEDVQKLDTLTAGGRQRQNHINESGVYALILGSRRPEAKRFKRWVTSEVLPSIRKTGTYSVPPTLVDIQRQARAQRGLTDNLETRVAALIGVQQMIAAVPGVKASMAAAVALSVIERETGLHLDGFRAALPRNSEPMATMNATAVGRAIAEPAVTTNRLLERLGLQRRNARGEWELTEAGKLHGEAYPYSNGKHSGYQILWKPSVVAILAEPEFELYLQ